MERVRFQNSYVFKYSPRPGTKAAATEDDIPEAVKKERNQRLLKVQERHSLAINQVRLGRRYEVLVEGVSKRDEGRLTGRTRTNQIVAFPGASDLAGRLVTVEIQRVTPLTLIGKVVDD
jgi:tRNA-2-methylthio-N6-dimethylallyladenosine synthase